MGGKPMALFSQTIRSVLFKWADFQTDLIPKRMRYQPLPKPRVQRVCCGLFTQVKGGTAQDHKLQTSLLLCCASPSLSFHWTHLDFPSKLPGLHSFHYLFFLSEFLKKQTWKKTQCRSKKLKEKKNHKITRRQKTKRRQVGGSGSDNLPILSTHLFLPGLFNCVAPATGTMLKGSFSAAPGLKMISSIMNLASN